MSRITKLLLSIGLTESAGIVGSVFTVGSLRDWYPYLNKPFFTPPSFVFGPVWITLYFLMGISLFLVISSKKAKLKWFFIQLCLNTFWSLAFFGLKNPELGLLIIIILWLTVVKTILEFKKINQNAVYLLYPYLIWISFATLLNLAISVLN
jgi:translocator protein